MSSNSKKKKSLKELMAQLKKADLKKTTLNGLFFLSYIAIPIMSIYFLSPRIKSYLVELMSSNPIVDGLFVDNSTYTINHVVAPYATLIAFLGPILAIFVIDLIVRKIMEQKYPQTLSKLRYGIFDFLSKLVNVIAVCGTIVVAAYGGFDPLGYGVYLSNFEGQNNTDNLSSQNEIHAYIDYEYEGLEGIAHVEDIPEQIEDVSDMRSAGSSGKEDNEYNRYIKFAQKLHSQREKIEMIFAIAACLVLPLGGLCSSIEKAKNQMNEEREYLVVQEGMKPGPYTFDKMRTMILSRKITPDTLVWRPRLNDWKRLKKIDELSVLLPPDLPEVKK